MCASRTSKNGDELRCLLEETKKLDLGGSPLWSASHGPQDDDRVNFFTDGKTQIDYVLVWKTRSDVTDKKSEDLRTKFFDYLGKHGLKMEEHCYQKTAKTIHFLLLSAPWTMRCYYAEAMSMKVPLKDCSETSQTRLYENIMRATLLFENVPRQPHETFNCDFKVSKLKCFLGSENKDTFFTNTQRHRILYEILANATYGNSHEGEVGVERLLRENVFIAAYPLHDNEYNNAPKTSLEQLTRRQILSKYWAQWTKWYKYQPLDHIRNYFGEKIALYFAWLGFYTTWLLPAAVIGTLIFVFGFHIASHDVPVKEVCQNGDLYTMCPVCNVCPTWNLSSICDLYKAGILFDNAGTLLFSFFISVWSVTFLEFWKRYNSTLGYQWDCLDFTEMEEPARPEFTAMAPLSIRNPITGQKEPYFPNIWRIRRIFAGSMVLVLMIAVVIIFLISVILYRIIIFLLVVKSGMIYSSASAITSITSSVISLIITLLLSRLYVSLARILTRWEMHRTQTAYEDAFTIKVFIFEFVNYYSTPVYIAFMKGRFLGYPGNESSIAGYRNENCNNGGCLIELAQQMVIIMTGKQIVNNIKEILLPKLELFWQRFTLGSNPKEQKQDQDKPWERDYRLVSYNGLFDEYLEMVIQFGFITIFVAACPLAPLFALLNNWIEVRLDAKKFVCEYRRPVAKPAQDIGVWMAILEAITSIAVIGNAFLVAFTSDILPRAYYQYKNSGNLTGYIDFSLAHAPELYVRNNTPCRYQGMRDSEGNLSFDFWVIMVIRLAFVILFEHVVFFIGRLIGFAVPDVPESVDIKLRRERFLAKQALSENEFLAGSWKESIDE